MNEYRVLGGKQEGKNPLGRATLGRKDNIKIDIREIE
jgi:hypothetical protein